jgi:hypothetical protein
MLARQLQLAALVLDLTKQPCVLNGQHRLRGKGGLSRLAIARLESAGAPVAPLLRRVGLTPEVIA